MDRHKYRKNGPYLATQLLLLWLVVGVAAAARRDTEASRSPVHSPTCHLSVQEIGVTAVGPEGLRASCKLRTMRSEILQPGHNNNSTLSAVSHSQHVTSLHLQCSRQVVFESELQPAAFSTFSRLQELSLESCKLKELPDRVFAGLPQLRRLSVSTHHEDWPGAVLSLSRDALTELPRLEYLDLSESELWQIPEGALCSCKSLTTINVTYNRLHRLADLGFYSPCYAPIAHLFLSYNEVDELPAKALPTPHLHTFHLDHNKLARIDDYAFRNLAEIKDLILSYNKLVALPKAAFLDLYQLKNLDLANNSLSSIPPSLFSSLGQLMSLNISHNQLSFSFDNPEPFIGLIRLVVLDLSYNKLYDLRSQVFNHLYSLQVLFLSNNQITYLSDGIFSYLANLHTLDLSDNKLSMLESGTLKGLSVLTHFFVDNNSLEMVSEASFKNSTSLQKLSMTGNHITEIPKAITSLSLLQVLDLSHNQIAMLERSKLKGLNNLKYLILSHNFIGNISIEAIPRMAHLEFLDLSFNQIGSVEAGAFEPFTELLTLNLSHNYLSHVNGIAAPLPKLLRFNVSQNEIEWFDYALIPRNLTELDLSGNAIKVLENHFEVHDKLNLRKILASNNSITAINYTSIPNGIEIIDFSDNLIDYVSSNTFLLKNRVNEINLENNQLMLLEESSLRLAPRSREATSASPPLLLLSNNPLKCDCGAEWLSRAARDAIGDRILTQQSTGSFLPRLGKVTDIQCTLPGLWQDASVPLVNVHQHQFLCTYRRHCFTLCHCCDFDACDCEQTCPNNCLCYHDHTWNHNIVDCGKQNWTAMPLGVPMDVTEAFLDGNNMGNLTSHALIGRKNLRVLYLNNSNIIDIQNRTFNGLRNLKVLRLDHNFLEKLHGYEFVLLHNLLELYINDNLISHIGNTTFTSLRSLEVLRLEGNRISVFPVWNLGLNPFLVEVGLHRNRWSCECNFLANLKAWLEANRIKASEVNEISCYHVRSGKEGPRILANSPGHCDHYVATAHMNTLMVNDYIMFSSISVGIILVIIVVVFIGVVYRRRIKLWASNQYSKNLSEKSSTYVEESEKLFDVFISHSNKDSTWVYSVLAPELEVRGYRTCAVYRNCSSPSAPFVAQAMSEGIACSKRLLLVVSRGLVDSEWCKYDFKSTHVDAARKLSKKSIILVNLDDIPRSELDSEMINLIRKASFSFRPRDPRFWERLRRALPSLRHRRRYEDNALGKSVSSPLVVAEAPASDQTKFTCHPNKNLTLNPYWETAITSNVPEWNMKPDLGAPPWFQVSAAKNSQSPSASSPRPPDGDHTYMSVSECDDTLHSQAEIFGGHSSPGASKNVHPSNAAVPLLMNGSASGQLSPPLLSLRHQHLVQNRADHYQEPQQYQVPHSPHPPQGHHKRSSPESDQSLLLNMLPKFRTPSITSKNLMDESSGGPLMPNNNNAANNSGSVHRDSNLSNELDESYISPLARPDEARNTSKRDASSSGAGTTWIFQSPVTLPSSTSGQTYYVVPDTSVSDASVSDASVPDASVSDASVPDASVPDASVSDASVPDASVPDASVVAALHPNCHNRLHGGSSW
ncbi:Toll/interleukin-1 receptor (TIR) domain [Trinorchestia longiramus]|nr:Toll/interleukin-1 receptor (TIR) domain [Trinorchestia longiramus]